MLTCTLVNLGRTPFLRLPLTGRLQICSVLSTGQDHRSVCGLMATFPQLNCCECQTVRGGIRDGEQTAREPEVCWERIDFRRSSGLDNLRPVIGSMSGPLGVRKPLPAI